MRVERAGHVREQEFRAWMDAQDWIQSTRQTRLTDARRVEKHYGDLDVAYEADKFAAILADLTYTAADNEVGKPNPSRLEIDGDIRNSLASYRSALGVYRQFREESDADADGLSQADRIRRFVISNYVEPARQRGEKELSVRSGDIHREMGLQNAMPSVCSAIGRARFEQDAGVRLIHREGPANSSTVVFTFEIGDDSLDVAGAEVALRERFGSPINESDKMVAFQTPRGRQIALQRDVQKVSIWTEQDSQLGEPPSGEFQEYDAAAGRHSNLPPRLRHEPPAPLAAQGYPKPVYNVTVQSRSELARLLRWYGPETAEIDRGALEELKRRFLVSFPDFEPANFASEAGGFYEEEDGYKRKLIARAQSLVAQQPPLGDAELGQGLYEVLTSRDSNLLGHYKTHELLSAVRKTHPHVLEAAIGKLVRNPVPPQDAIEEFLAGVWPVLAEGQQSKPYDISRTLPTTILALVKPIEAIAVRYQRFWNAGKLLLDRSLFANAPLSGDEYTDVMAMSRQIFAIMRDEWGWRPRDLWDVQGFIWVTCEKRDDMAPGEGTREEGQQQAMPKPTNLILYGPPGTGKTYATAEEAVRLCDGEAPGARADILNCYDELRREGRVEFVTFHQSFSYEEFIEGLRPTTGDDDEVSTAGFRLEPRNGVFRNICALADQSRRSRRKGWGVRSLGSPVLQNVAWTRGRRRIYSRCCHRGKLCRLEPWRRSGLVTGRI